LTPLSPGTLIGPYRLERPLGEGAAAVVWLATASGPGGFRKQVALKLLKATDDDRLVADLLREARLTALLAHPNTVDVYAVDQFEGQFYVAMELVEGGALRHLISKVKRAHLGLPVSVVLDLGIDIAHGLAHAHTATDDDGRPLNVLHRDLKPENILLDSTGRARITDFGLAKVIGEATRTALGDIKGTSRYVPPEVWKGSREFHPRGDLFALGCILYELVTLRRLFDGPMHNVFEQIAKRDSVTEAEAVAEVAPALAPVVERLIRRDPTRRYQEAGEVLADLEAVRSRLRTTHGVDAFVRLATAEPGSAAEEPGIDRLLVSRDPRWVALAVRASGREPPPPEPPPRSLSGPTFALLIAASAVALALVVLLVVRTVG